MNKEELIALAKEETKRSYSPYSHFAVGAALLTKDNKVFLGTNIENAAFGLSMCAERNAIFNAYVNGVKKDEIVALAIIADTEDPVSPCGSCRQVLSELFPKNGKIYLANFKGNIKETNIVELLPYSFSKDDLN